MIFEWQNCTKSKPAFEMHKLVYFLSSRIISDFAFRKLFCYKVNAIFSCHREQFYFLWIFFHSVGWYHRQRQVKSFNWKIHFQKKTIFREIMSSLLVRHNSMLRSRSFQLSSCRTPFVMIIEYLKWLWKSIVNDLKTRSILRANVNRTTTICFWIKFDKSKVKWDAIANMASVPNLTMIF